MNWYRIALKQQAEDYKVQHGKPAESHVGNIEPAVVGKKWRKNRKLDTRLLPSHRYTVAKTDVPLTAQDYEDLRKRFGQNRGCSFKRDRDGIYCHTHRARSESYPSVAAFPQEEYDFICSTS